MPPDDNNFKIEFGVVKGTLERVVANQERMEKKVDQVDEKLDRVCEQLPKHEERIATLEDSRRFWNRVISGVVVGVIIACITALLALAK